MSNRFLFLISCFPAYVLACVWPGGTVGAGERTTQPRPNLLILLTDDQRFDMLGCAGNRIIQTPVVDGLAKEGVRFTNAFVTTAICPTSRASIFTGLYERTHGYSFGTKPLADKHVAERTRLDAA